VGRLRFLGLVSMLFVLFLVGCSSDKGSEYDEANQVAQKYFEAFVNKDHDNMMKRLSTEERNFMLENEFLTKGEVEFPGNYEDLKSNYMLAGYSKYYDSEKVLLFWGKYFSPAENNSERNMWIVMKKDGDKWAITESDPSNSNLKKEVFNGVNNKDEYSYYLHNSK